MRSGKVAERAGVNVQTLRYYERRGLLPEPSRTESGYRSYGVDAIHLVRFVKRAQELGFSLAEVATLLDLAGGGPDNCDAAGEVARKRMADIELKMTRLQAMHDSLQALIATCERPRSERECPILEALAHEEDDR